MTWREVRDRLSGMSDSILDGVAFISCEPSDSDPVDGLRYMGEIDSIESDSTNAYASFVGERNDEQNSPQP